MIRETEQLTALERQQAASKKYKKELNDFHYELRAKPGEMTGHGKMRGRFLTRGYIPAWYASSFRNEFPRAFYFAALSSFNFDDILNLVHGLQIPQSFSGGTHINSVSNHFETLCEVAEKADEAEKLYELFEEDVSEDTFKTLEDEIQQAYDIEQELLGEKEMLESLPEDSIYLPAKFRLEKHMASCKLIKDPETGRFAHNAERIRELEKLYNPDGTRSACRIYAFQDKTTAIACSADFARSAPPLPPSSIDHGFQAPALRPLH